MTHLGLVCLDKEIELRKFTPSLADMNNVCLDEVELSRLSFDLNFVCLDAELGD